MKFNECSWLWRIFRDKNKWGRSGGEPTTIWVPGKTNNSEIGNSSIDTKGTKLHAD